MDFEFDKRKSKVNKKKHGINSIEAQALWEDPDRIEIAEKTTEEPRSILIGKISEQHWSSLFTYRGEKIRIISVRRSRIEEIELYEG